MVLEIITENNDGEVPSQEDLQWWAGEYDLTMPVLADAEGIMWDYAADEGGSVGLPFTVVVDRGEKIDTIMSGANSQGALDLL
jgi:hypothetical protein